MTALEFRVQVNPRPQGVELSWTTPDGDVIQLGTVTTPANIPALMSQVSGFIALELVNAVWEVRSGM